MNPHLESLIIFFSITHDEPTERILIGELFLTLCITLQMLIEVLNQIGRVNGRSNLF